MADEPQWPGQEPGDLATYTMVSRLLGGVDARALAILPLERYGRWQALMRALFDAHHQGGHAAVFAHYLELVYAHPPFALLMATLGMQCPTGEWQLAELPKWTFSRGGASGALPAPPAAPPRRKLPKNWSAFDVLAGYYENAPVERHAVREEQVYAALRELGEASAAELARYTGQDRGNVHRRVQKLLEAGQIERLVTAKAIVYRVRA